jgi:hypothetical protein
MSPFFGPVEKRSRQRTLNSSRARAVEFRVSTPVAMPSVATTSRHVLSITCACDERRTTKGEASYARCALAVRCRPNLLIFCIFPPRLVNFAGAAGD